MNVFVALAFVAASLSGAANLDAALTRAALPEDEAGAEIQRYLHPRVPAFVVPETR